MASFQSAYKAYRQTCIGHRIAAAFASSYEIIKMHEGGYVSAETAKKIGDSGGETYKGIARNANPNWPGWKIVDAYKAQNGTPKHGSYIKSAELDTLVKDLAKKNYWDAFRGDLIKDQAVANLMMDIAFGSGPVIAIKSVQRVLRIDDNGKMGPQTMNAINGARPAELLYGLGEYRTEWLKKNLSGKSFLQVLLSRTASYLSAYKKPLAIGGGALVMGLGILFWLKNR